MEKICMVKNVLHRLVEELCKIAGIRWIRILYCYPEEITDELIEVIKEEPKVCHYLDLPIQHASDQYFEKDGKKNVKTGTDRYRQKTEKRNSGYSPSYDVDHRLSRAKQKSSMKN